MKRLASIETAEEFVVALIQWKRLWQRKGATPGNASARRHARELARRHIRAFKKRHNISSLPRVQRATSVADLWMQAGAEDVKLIFPPKASLSYGVEDARRRLKRALHESVKAEATTSIDLVNASNAAKSRLPSLAEAASGERRLVRGLYLEAVGAAIMPNLSEAEIASLKESGATVVDKRIVALAEPVAAELASEPMAGDQTIGTTLPEIVIALDKGGRDFWHLSKIGAQIAHAKGLRGTGVMIGILDTGINASHAEFAGRDIHFRAFATNGEPLPTVAAKDYGTHGTHVAAVCAGATAGVAPQAEIAVAAVLTEHDANGQMYGFLAQIAAGINWLAKEAGQNKTGADIINASLGGNGASAEYYDTVLGHRVSGKLMVAAIGNHGGRGMGNHSVPGRFDCVLAVGATDIKDNVAAFSAWGPTYVDDTPTGGFKPDLVAPGVQIRSALANGSYGCMNGTSMACPIVTGAAALLMQQDASLRRNPDELIDRILSLTHPLPVTDHNANPQRCGRGRLDLAQI